MKYLYFLFFLCISREAVYSQKGIIEMFTTKDRFDDTEYIKSNYIKKYYTPTDSDGDRTITFRGIELNLSLYRKDSVIWEDDSRTIFTRMMLGRPSKSSYSQLSKWNKEGYLIFSSKINTAIAKDTNDVERIYKYDDLNRLISITVIKPNIPSKKLHIECSYDDNSIFPKIFKEYGEVEVTITREEVLDTLYFYGSMGIDAEFEEMVRRNLGKEASEEEVLEALGPLAPGVISFSKVYLLNPDIYMEEQYERIYAQDYIQTAEFRFDKNWKLISKIWPDFSAIKSLQYDFTDDSRVKSIKINDKLIEVDYDSEGNKLKDYIKGKIHEYKYDNNRLISQIIWSLDFEILNEYIEYDYK